MDAERFREKIDNDEAWTYEEREEVAKQLENTR